MNSEPSSSVASRLSSSATLRQCISVPSIIALIVVGVAGWVYALVAESRTGPTAHPPFTAPLVLGASSGELQPVSRASAERPHSKKTALMALEEQSRWATRIQIDPVQQSVTIWRDLVYGLNPSMVESEHGLMIPDEGGIQQVAVFDRSITLGDMEIRVVLHSFGPQAAYHDRPPASTEIVLWVNGQARVAGFLEGSEFGADGTPVWDRLSIYRLGGVLVASAVMGDYPLVRRGVSNGNLSTENPWLMEPRGSFPSLEDINRFLQEDDDEASPTSLPATSTVARRKPLPS